MASWRGLKANPKGSEGHPERFEPATSPGWIQSPVEGGLRLSQRVGWRGFRSGFRSEGQQQGSNGRPEENMLEGSDG